MMRHALRRLLWTLPTLVGISLVTFLFLSYVPDPTDDPAIAKTFPAAEIARLRREHFLDLPRFLNLAPADVRTRAAIATDAIAEGGPSAPFASYELARLGGAALPYVLPRFDALPPEPRARLALALAPVARRMGIASESEIADPAHAAAFWSRLWDDRGVEFRHASVHSAVGRLFRGGGPMRVTDLVELDTFVLDDVLSALEIPTDSPSLAHATALIDVAAHVTGREDRIGPTDDLDAARACVERWQAYWVVYRSDFVAFTGPSRIAAMVIETRYGKWALGAVTHRFGRIEGSGSSVLDELALRAKVTLAIVFGAIAMAYAAAIPLGAFSAPRRGSRIDLAVMATVLGLYAIPTAVAAVLTHRVFGAAGPRLVVAELTLALALVAAPTGQQRGALAAMLSQDHVTAAIARGSSRARALLVHGLRNALLPVVTLATLEAPMALGGAFVVERVFDLRGLGEVTILAVQRHDIAWLMALSIFAAGIAAIFVVLADVACALIDHRLEPAMIARRGSS